MMSSTQDMISEYVLSDIAKRNGQDPRPGKRVTMRVHARCGIAECGRYIPEGVSEQVVHVDDVALMLSLVEDWRTASEVGVRVPSKPPVDGPAQDGKVSSMQLPSRVFSEVEVEIRRQEMSLERARTPGGPSPEVPFAEAFFAIAHRGMKPLIMAAVVDLEAEAREREAAEALAAEEAAKLATEATSKRKS